MTTVGLIGGGPALEALRAALADTNATARPVDASGVAASDLAVVVDAVDSATFDTASTTARASDTPLITVELGGVGGRPAAGVDAAVSGFAPGTACYDCLRRRVEASDPETDRESVDATTARFAGALAGREAATLLSGGESNVLGGVIELPHTQRRLLSVPDCDCVGERDRTLRRNHDPRSLEDALTAAELALDDRVGPVASVGEVESFPVPYYLTTLSSTPFSDADVPEHAAGVAADWNPAFMKALGEALERYSASVYRASSFSDDHPAPVDPGRFVRPDDRTPAVDTWYPAESLSTGETVGLPAELVVFPPPERRIRPAITTGLGLGNGGCEALLSGLYEVVERDAAMLAWYSTYEPLGLDVGDEGYETLVRRVRAENLDVTALLLTQDIDVPVVCACVHRDGEWPRFAAGMSADLDPDAAARGALEEAIQNWLELRRMGPEHAAEESGAIGPYADFPDAARAFIDPPATVPASTVGSETVRDGGAELDALVSRVTAVGLDAYGARLTPPDVESLGFEAVRVVVPEAQPLFTGTAYFGDRARAVPESLGFEPRLDRDHHPFP